VRGDQDRPCPVGWHLERHSVTTIRVQHEDEEPREVEVVTEIAAAPLINGLKERLGLKGEYFMIVEKCRARRPEGTREIFTVDEDPDTSMRRFHIETGFTYRLVTAANVEKYGLVSPTPAGE
jgi:hypothetical protein